MNISDCVLQSGEKIIFALRNLYSSYGYKPYRMSKFEEYDLYAKNKDFLVSDNVITFTDTDGKLMALKPDVTLSIIKNSADEQGTTRRVYYNENVYRVSKGTGSYKEMMQSGVECFGKVGAVEISEMLSLAAKSLLLFSDDAVISVSDLGIVSGIVEDMKLSAQKKAELYKAIGEKNLHEINELCGDTEQTKLLCALISTHGTVQSAIGTLDGILNENSSYAQFKQVLAGISESEVKEAIRIDFSATCDFNYYNGIVFKGFIKGIPDAVLSGGQYDILMRKMGRKSSAIGFAVFTDLLDRLDGEEKDDDGYINVALPKGRLGEKIYGLFAEAGYECPSILEQNRKLIFENKEKRIRYFWVKPSDVAIYVERGAADIGVAGKDILLEYSPDVYELCDLKKGKCRMAVAAPKSFCDDGTRTLRVATKFAEIAKAHYRKKGRDIDIIHLNGSIEIAPILGLSDVIVDIVETGATLRENDLEVVETIVPISARLIANKTSYKFKQEKIQNISNALGEITEENK